MAGRAVDTLFRKPKLIVCLVTVLGLTAYISTLTVSSIFDNQSERMGKTSELRTLNQWQQRRNQYILEHKHGGFIDLKGSIRVPIKFLENYKNPCWRDVVPNNSVSKLVCLPYFFLLGVMKSGTWDIFSSLTLHPDIEIRSKEPLWIARCHFNCTQKNYYANYCSGKYQWTFQSYLNYFGESTTKIDMTKSKKKNGEFYHPKITADCSPDTFFDWTWSQNRNIPQYDELPYHNNPELLFMMNPKAKMIVSIRNPTYRLYSGYWQSKPKNPSPEDFHQRVIESIAKFNKCTETRELIDCAVDDKLEYEARKFGVRVFVGIYYIYFLEWFRVFPREQFFIIKFEKYTEDRAKVMANVFDFLDLAPLNGTSLISTMNKAKPQRKTAKGSMLDSTKQILDNFYRPYNEKLSELLGSDDYSWAE
ncbi:hypothetical protein ScPMuIL_000738 [Solemya velum]